MSQRDELALQDYLDHIRQAVDRIQRYLRNIDKAGFFNDEQKQDAVIRNLEVIGEAAANIQRHFPQFALGNPTFR